MESSRAFFRGATFTPARWSSEAVAAIILVQEGEHQVLRLDEAVVVGQGLALGVAQGLLELGRQFVDSHGGRRAFVFSP